MTDFAYRLQQVEEEIAAACRRAGRDRSEVELLAVSKTKPVEMIRAFYDLGLRAFGENRPQELRDKIPVCPSDIRWHMIGQLQKNKIKYVVPHAALIHSVDSVELARAIQAEAEKKQAEVSVLLEVNAAGEATKSGFRPEELLPAVQEIAGLSRVHVKGLMTVAPFVEDPEEDRPVFRMVRQLSVDINNENIDNISMNVLSMGMTNDMAVAIEEGATCVRVGTALFGARGV